MRRCSDQAVDDASSGGAGGAVFGEPWVAYGVFVPAHGGGSLAGSLSGAGICAGALLGACVFDHGAGAAACAGKGDGGDCVYLSPFAVMPLSGPLLGERVRALFWLWAGLGFAGSVVDLAARCRAGPFGCGVCGDEFGAGYLV